MADMLATVPDLAAYLQRDPTELADEDAVTGAATLAIEAATSLVQAAAGQRIVQVVDDVLTVDLDRRDSSAWLDLPEQPVTAVSAVLVGATAVNDYTVQLRKGRLYRPCGWRSAAGPSWAAPSTVTVTYTHGYPPGDQRLQLARTFTLALAATGYENLGGVTSEQIDDYTVRYESASARMEIGPVLHAAIRRAYGRPGTSVRLVTA